MAQKRIRAGKTRWVARYRDPAGKEHSKTFDTRRDAVAWESEREREMRRGEWLDPETMKITVRHLVQAAIDTTDNPSTKNGRRGLLHNLGDLADMPASKVKPAFVKDWRNTLTEGRPWASGHALSESTAGMYAAILHGIFTRAINDDIIVRHPMRGMKGTRIAGAVKRDDIPTREDVLSLIKTANSTAVGVGPNPQLARMIQVAAETGMRGGEICGLRVRSIDFLRREIHVVEQFHQRTHEFTALKTSGSQRTIPVSESTLRVLAKQLEGRNVAPDETVFQTKAGHPYTSSSIGAQFRAVAKRAGMQTTFHGLRHHYVSVLIEAGINAVHIAKLVGHASPKMTLDVYSHVFPSADESIRKALREALRDEGGTEESTGTDDV